MSGFTKVYKDVLCDVIKNCGYNCATTYIMLLTHNNINKGLDGCFPSYKCLTEELGIKKRALMDHLNELEEKGFIIIKSGEKGVSNKYYFPKEEGLYSAEQLNEIHRISRRKYVSTTPSCSNGDSSSVEREIVSEKEDTSRVDQTRTKDTTVFRENATKDTTVFRKNAGNDDIPSYPVPHFPDSEDKPATKGKQSVWGKNVAPIRSNGLEYFG